MVEDRSVNTIGKRAFPWTAAGAISAVAAIVACANSATHSPGDLGDAGDDGGLNFDTNGVDGFNPDVVPPPPGTSCSPPACGTDTPCDDFPAAPIIDATPDDGSPPTPADAASHFTTPASPSGGPCVFEPGDGVLMPSNWLRPRFHYTPSTGQTLFQIKVHAPGQTNDLVAYTTSKTWKMPRSIWNRLRVSDQGQTIQYTVAAVDPTSGATVNWIV